MLKNIILLFCLIGAVCHGEVRRVESLESIEKELTLSDDGTLILLDMNGVLIKTTDVLLDLHYLPWIYLWYQINAPMITKEGMKPLVRILQNDLKIWEPVSPVWNEMIPRARSLGAKVVVFTKVIYDHSDNAIRARMLHSYGLPIQNDLSGLGVGKFYEYQEGVIETEHKLKGPVLEEIILNLPIKPTKIIFVDDMEEQVLSVDQTCLGLGIRCIAFHYEPRQRTPFLDEKIADFQMRTLVKQHRWLSDEEARLLLESVTSDEVED